MRQRCVEPICAAIFFVALLMPESVSAVIASADANFPTGGPMSKPGTPPGVGVTGDVCAHSSVPKVPGSPNKTATGFLLQTGTPTVPFTPIDCSVTVKFLQIPIRGFPVPKPGNTPSVTLAGKGDIGTAKAPPKTVITTSTTIGAGQVAFGQAQWTSFTVPPTLFVDASVTGFGPAKAAAESKDPFLFEPGEYIYAPVLDTLSMLVVQDSDSVSGIASLSFEAESPELDSSGPLWELILTLTADVFELAFESSDFLGLDDLAVESELLAALEFSVPGEVSLLAPHTLFSVDFVSNVPFVFSSDLGGAAFLVPAPQTFWLLFAGMVALYVSTLTGRRRRQTLLENQRRRILLRDLGFR